MQRLSLTPTPRRPSGKAIQTLLIGCTADIIDKADSLALNKVLPDIERIVENLNRQYFREVHTGLGYTAIMVDEQSHPDLDEWYFLITDESGDDLPSPLNYLVGLYHDEQCPDGIVVGVDL